jgi:hypothetical protein
VGLHRVKFESATVTVPSKCPAGRGGSSIMVPASVSLSTVTGRRAGRPGPGLSSRRLGPNLNPPGRVDFETEFFAKELLFKVITFFG